MKHGDQGFTLIEVLIAMAITAVIALVAYTSLSTVISGVEAARAEGERVALINRAMTVFSRDIRQVVDRPVRDEFGAVESGLEGGPLARQTLAFTRAGWHNTVGLPRSTLQRVAYYLDEDRLVRASWPVLDRTNAVEPNEVTLLEGVARFEVQFLEGVDQLRINRGLELDRRYWSDNWLANVSDPDATLGLPLAVLILLEVDGWEAIERLYVLASP